MHLGRNDLCLCGTEKTYKRCCYGKVQYPVAENNLKSLKLQDVSEEDAFDTQVALLKAMHG